MRKTWILSVLLLAGCGHLLDGCLTLAGRGDVVQRKYENERAKNEQEDVFPLRDLK